MRPTVRAWGLLAAACALSFVVGLLVGRRTSPLSTRGSGSMNPDAVVATLTRELSLDTVQQGQVRAIFERHQTAVDEAWRAVAPHVRAAVDSTQMEIVRVLTPEQQARFILFMRATHPGMPTTEIERR